MSVAVFCHSPLCASASPSRLPVVIGPVVSVCLLPCIVVLCCALLLYFVVLCCALLCFFVPHYCEERHIVLDGGPSESAV